MPINYSIPPVLHSAMVHAEPQGNLTGASVHEQLLELDTEKVGYDKAFLSGYKNKLINGNFDIWQRGTSQTTDGMLSADRWGFWYVGGTISKLDMVPGHVTGLKQMVRWQKTSTSAGTSYMSQKIESVWTLQNGKAVLQLTGLSNSGTKTGACQLIQRFGTGGSPSTAVATVEQPFVLTGSYQRFTFVFDVPSISGKTLGTNKDDALELRIAFDTATHDVYLGGLQLEEGSVATPFESRHIAQELALCQRYYEKTSLRVVGVPASGTFSYLAWFYKVRKRTIPTPVLGAGSVSAGWSELSDDFVTIYVASATTPVIGAGSSADAEL